MAEAQRRPADAVARLRYAGTPVSTFCRRRGFLARPGQVVAEPDQDGRAVVLNVGLGPSGSATAATFRRAAAAAVRAAGPARTLRLDLAPLDGDDLSEADQACALAEGAALAGYRYGGHRSDGRTGTLREVVVVTGAHEAVAAALAACAGTCLARDLVNCPGGELTPPEFARRIQRIAEREGLTCAVHEDPGELGLAGLVAVGRGSRQPPRFVRLSHGPADADDDQPSIGLVGKGITFDSGGLSLKPTERMRSMKSDMGGAAAVVGALAALPRLGLPVRVDAFLPLAENMPDGAALRVGDVVRHVDGSSTEIVDTDNEGRVVLADVLVHAAERCEAVLDVATLTSAVAQALGTRAGAVFANDEQLAGTVLAGAARAGEPLWRLPLLTAERRHLRSAVADRVNASHREGDAVQAALFLQEFVPATTPWAHLDIAAAAFNAEGPYDEIPHGGTGFGVRTLVEALKLLSADAAAPTCGPSAP
ncbi:M17 family metallopeptidase [Saccharopolyspora sp. NFXS83]|uniref:leucyl aminopeptidase family protein n=1 Tax=Saccharopolyspora sp. NFXS83 TaxID=2993560 RepID=UPI00224B77DE|nr:M17 family metallopeptidase [Saccharopolyspora sp. NFXS83]MCX2729179.1 M17 family metallopeptidase [Saccharopolyspora sp. NFXS83]